MRRYLCGSVLILLLSCASVLDQQGAAMPGVNITAKNPQTGFNRSEVTDSAGVYRIAAVPVGIYEVTAELTGFQRVAKQDVEVNVGQTVAIDFSLKVATIAE